MKKISLKNVSKKDNSNKSKFDYFYIFAKIFHSSLQSSDLKGLNTRLDSRLELNIPDLSTPDEACTSAARIPKCFKITASNPGGQSQCL